MNINFLRNHLKNKSKMPASKKSAKSMAKSSGTALRIALSQMNSIVGDFNFNTNKIKIHLKKARKIGADVILFPELAITGYPPEDLLLKDSF